MSFDRGPVKVRVESGETTLTGNVRRRVDAEMLPKIVAKVPGVVSVHSDLAWSDDE
jgi:osmotically-inducible protein OsmY